MARKRNRRGQFTKASHKRRVSRRRATPRRRTSRRISVVRHPALVNPRRRRRSYRSNPRRYHRRYRRNPALGSIFSMGTLKLAAYTGAGFLGTPLLAGFVMGYIPITDATTRKWVGYGVDLGAAWGLSWGAEKIVGREAGRAVLIGGIAYVAVSLVREFLPTMIGTGTAATGTSAYPLSRMGAQPLLGTYQHSGMGSALTSRTADRLNPAGRF